MAVGCPKSCSASRCRAFRVLGNAELPNWHNATPLVSEAARRAAQHCQTNGVDIAERALQYSVANPDMATCVVGSAKPANVKLWVDWATKPLDQKLLNE